MSCSDLAAGALTDRPAVLPSTRTAVRKGEAMASTVAVLSVLLALAVLARELRR